MSQDIEISIAKLSAPVDALGLDRRACRALQRANIYTVAEILLHGKPRPGAIKQMGSLTADRIWQALAMHLGLSEELLASETASAGDVWGVPVDLLPLFPSTLQALAQLGYSTIDDLVRARVNGYRDLQSIDAQELLKVYQHLQSYLVRTAQARLMQIQRNHPTLVSSSPKTSTGIESDGASRLPMDHARRRSVLECRAIHGLSVEDISASLGLSTVQVSKAIYEAQKWLRENLSNLRPFLDQLEEKSKLLQSSLGKSAPDLHHLVRQLSAESRDPYLALPEMEVERIILVLRTLAMHPKGWFLRKMEPEWPTLIWLSSHVEPILKAYQRVADRRSGIATSRGTSRRAGT